MESTNLTIFDKDKFKFDESIYFIFSYVEKPLCMHEGYGKIRDRLVINNSVYYAVELLDIFNTNKNTYLNFVHNNHLKTIHKNSKIQHNKKIECVNIVDDINFKEKFCNLLNNNYIIVNAMDINSTREDNLNWLDYVNDEIKNQLKQMELETKKFGIC